MWMEQFEETKWEVPNKIQKLRSCEISNQNKHYEIIDKSLV